MSFHVWNTFHNYKNYEMLDGTSQRAKQLHALFKNDQAMKEASPLVVEMVEKLKANAKELLALPLYQDFAAEFERTKAKMKKRKVYWYSLYDGPDSVAALANKSKYPALYPAPHPTGNTIYS